MFSYIKDKHISDIKKNGPTHFANVNEGYIDSDNRPHQPFLFFIYHCWYLCFKFQVSSFETLYFSHSIIGHLLAARQQDHWVHTGNQAKIIWNFISFLIFRLIIGVTFGCFFYCDIYIFSKFVWDRKDSVKEWITMDIFLL